MKIICCCVPIIIVLVSYYLAHDNDVLIILELETSKSIFNDWIGQV